MASLRDEPGVWELLTELERVRAIQILQSIQSPEDGTKTVHGISAEKFCVEVLGLRPTAAALKYGITSPLSPGQLKVLESVESYKRTIVTSANLVGKSYLAAIIALSYLYGAKNRIVITTAGNFGQVERQIWGNIHALAQGASQELAGRFLKTKIEIGPKWYAVGLSTDDYSKFTGEHAEGGVLVLVDEAISVAPEIISAAGTLIPGEMDRLVAILNPTTQTSWAFEACKSPLWHHVVLDARDHPNVIHRDSRIIPGAVTYEWVEDQKIEYGEDSLAYHSKVTGQWSSHDDDAIIPVSWYMEAQRREEWPTDVERGSAIGVDIAGPGGDLLVISAIVRGKWRILAWRQKLDYMAGVGLIAHWINELGAAACSIDDTAVGSVVSARLREMKRGGIIRQECRLIPKSFGARANERRKFAQCRDELWWNSREIMRTGQLAMPTDTEISGYSLPRGHSVMGQITSAVYEMTTENRIDVYDRRSNHNERTKILPSVSPDLAHSFILACWAWKEVKADETVDEPRTTQEIITRAFHASIKDKFKEAAVNRREGRDSGEKDPSNLW